MYSSRELLQNSPRTSRDRGNHHPLLNNNFETNNEVVRHVWPLLFLLRFAPLHSTLHCNLRHTTCHTKPSHITITQWANGGGGLQSPTSQHGGHQNRRTRQGLVWCIIIITHSHKGTHSLIWVGGTVCQKIAIYKALILSHGHFVFSAGGGGLNAVRWRTRYVWVSEVEDCNFRCTPRWIYQDIFRMWKSFWLVINHHLSDQT